MGSRLTRKYNAFTLIVTSTVVITHALFIFPSHVLSSHVVSSRISYFSIQRCIHVLLFCTFFTCGAFAHFIFSPTMNLFCISRASHIPIDIYSPGMSIATCTSATPTSVHKQIARRPSTPDTCKLFLETPPPPRILKCGHAWQVRPRQVNE